MIVFQILLRIFIVLFLISIIVIPLVLQVVYNYNLTNGTLYYFSFYSIVIFTYIFIQFVFSILNNKKQLYLKSNGDIDESHDTKKVNICVVGYKEDPVYYRQCLESALVCSKKTPNFNRLYVIIDGQDNEDIYMKDLFLSIFKTDSIYINLDKLPSQTKSDDESLDFNTDISLIQDKKFVCITQPHGGKRHGLYTAFKFSILENKIFNKNIKAIFCNDSDTVMGEESANELYKCLRYENIGASTGVLHMLNFYDSPISFLVGIRYWFAFHLERAYQSFNKAVLCVSGPIGMYKLDQIEPIIDEWVNQTFMGKECTYGDDRHLTVKILEQGKEIVFTPKSISKTETPDTLFRFYKQQIRWAKSSYREFLWNIKCVHKHSLWMTVDLTYQSLYSFIVLGFMFYILLTGSFYTIGLYFLSLFIVGFAKGLYASIYERNLEYLFFASYGVIFLLVIIPARLFAMVNMYDISWGTSSRLHVSDKFGSEFIFLIVWYICFGSCIGYSIYNSTVEYLLHPTLYPTNNYWFFVSSILVFVLSFVLLKIYLRFRSAKESIQQPVQETQQVSNISRQDHNIPTRSSSMCYQINP